MDIAAMFEGQGWFAIAGQIVLVFTAITGSLPDRFVQKIPVLGTVWPIFNWLAGNVFNNINHPKGMAAQNEWKKKSMQLKQKFGIGLVCLMFSMGCSGFPIVELIPPVFNFALGFYDHNDYYSKECLWYDEIKLNDDTKKWLLESNPPEIVSEDLSKVSRNNDIYREVCKKDKSMADKMKDKANRVLDKTLMATEEEDG